MQLIFDCRPTNDLFRRPPGTPLATAECLASFELECDSAGPGTFEDLIVYVGMFLLPDEDACIDERVLLLAFCLYSRGTRGGWDYS